MKKAKRIQLSTLFLILIQLIKTYVMIQLISVVLSDITSYLTSHLLTLVEGKLPIWITICFRLVLVLETESQSN